MGPRTHVPFPCACAVPGCQASRLRYSPIDIIVATTGKCSDSLHRLISSRRCPPWTYFSNEAAPQQPPRRWLPGPHFASPSVAERLPRLLCGFDDRAIHDPPAAAHVWLGACGSDRCTDPTGSHGSQEPANDSAIREGEPRGGRKGVSCVRQRTTLSETYVKVAQGVADPQTSLSLKGIVVATVVRCGCLLSAS